MGGVLTSVPLIFLVKISAGKEEIFEIGLQHPNTKFT